MTEAPLEREAQGTWAKLRRRKVVQWGLAYATAAFGLAQGLSHVVSTYHFPEWILQLGTLMLIIGLPIVVVLAWYHGDKGEQKVGRVEIAVLTVLLLGAAGALWWYGSRLEPAASAVVVPESSPNRAVPKDAPSVGVLPFVNLSEDPANEYFSDGLTEEILNVLARTPGLYVPARTSSFQFKGRKGDVTEFARLLGVATVLEGSVRRVDGRVRITAQLVNAADGYHLWSQAYDRELKDIFLIQSEIASAIAGALKIRLTAQQMLAAEIDPSTRNLAAYEAFLKGRHELNKGQPESVARGIEHLEEAVRLDPGFAAAHAGIAVGVLKQAQFVAPMRMLWTPERQAAFDRARASLDRALSVAPNRAEVLAAAGYVERYRNVRTRDEVALEYFDRALALNPSDGEVLTWRNWELARHARYEELLGATEAALLRDPLSLEALDFRIQTLRLLGYGDEVGPLVERGLQLDPAWGERWLAVLAADRGDRPAVIRHCIAAARAGDRLPRCGYPAFADLGMKDEVLARANPAAAHAALGDFREAVRLAEEGYKLDPAWWEWDLVFWHWWAGNFEESWQHFELAERSDQLGTGYTGWGRSPLALISAADSARRIGRLDDARRLRDQVADILAAQERAAAPREPNNRFQFALLRAYDGEMDRAAALVIAGLRSDMRWQHIMHAPLLEDVRKLPDVQAALSELHVQLESQRREVVEMLCSDPSLPDPFKPAAATCAGRDSRS